MTSLLPPNLLRLFQPRAQPPFLKPLTKDESVRGPNKLSGCGTLVKRIRDEAEEAEYREGMADAPATKGETNGEPLAEKGEVVEKNAIAVESGREVAEDSKEGIVEGSKGKRKEKESANGKTEVKGGKAVDGSKKKKDKISEMGIVGQEAVKMRRELRVKRKEEYKKNLEKNYRPQDDAQAIGDPYKTLFLSRLSKKVTEADLRHEFEMYGAIERIRMVRDLKGKSMSYAFIVYERERDMKTAYKDADGISIHHKKILVDVERGRTVKGWRPRKLGGGLGGRPKPVDPKEAAMMPFGGGGPGGPGGFRGGRGGPPGGFRGGGRGGGFRGGFGGGGGDFGGGGRGGFGGGGFGGRGGGFGGRGGFGGDRGGFGGGRGGFGGGDRGGFGGGGGGFGGPPGGGYGGGGGGLSGPPGGNFGAPGGGYSNGPPGGGGFNGGGGGGGGYKRDFDGGSAGGALGRGGFGAGGGYEDRDAKRPRY